jgi:hypothetical protein
MVYVLLIIKKMEIWGTFVPHEYSREIIVFHTFKQFLSLK